MREKYLLYPLLMFLLLLFMPFPRLSSSEIVIIRVPADYSTIQEAIDAASIGDLILVDAGIYKESLVLNKSLSLVADDRMNTIIDGSNQTDVVIVTADGVLIDGFTIKNGSRSGIYARNCDRLTISGNTITLNSFNGVFLDQCGNSIITRNLISSNRGAVEGLSWGIGIHFQSSNGSTISRNIVTDSFFTLSTYNSSDDSIMSNIIGDSFHAADIHYCNMMRLDHNLFVNLEIVSPLVVQSNVSWSDGSEGNYWDDYVGLDDGSNGRTAGDAVGDTGLPHEGLDDYPLVRPLFPIPVVWENTAYPVALDSNSTISAFRFTQSAKQLAFNTTGPANTIGFCNVTIPKNLLSDNPWTFLLDGNDITSTAQVTDNNTHSFIYLTYNHSNRSIQIIGTSVVPEVSMSGALATLALLSAASLAILFGRKRTAKKSKTQ